jgi:hypothetical protein
LYDSAGPFLKLRIARDLADRDESFLDTADFIRANLKRDEPRAIVMAQKPDGSWGDLVSTELFMLRLCELGLESADAIEFCLEKALLPSLGGKGFVAGARSAEQKQLTRDMCLRMITRARRHADELVKIVLEQVLTEWEFGATHGHAPHPPTLPAYAALCSYPWEDDDVERVSRIVTAMIKRAEESDELAASAMIEPYRFRVRDKEHYLAHPEQLLYELECSARLGIINECNSTRWMFEELEIRQDSDGFTRFDNDFISRETSPLPWYYPIEAATPETRHIEWTFRAGLVFKLVEFDV